MNKSNKPTTQNADSRQEIIIPVMGASGAGKSTFVNYLVQAENQKSRVGHGLTSCTAEVLPIRLTFPDDDLLKHYTIVLLDTPGFDDTSLSDAVILGRITNWNRHQKNLGGVIYLHDISQDRFFEKAQKNLDMLSRMCGDAALKKVIFGTTKWSRTPVDIGKKHEHDLKENHWRAMLDKGTKFKRFEDSRDSALSFIKHIVEDTSPLFRFRSQEEMADGRKIASETNAGMEYADSMQEIIIPVMGASGAGKSTFVNYLVQDEKHKSKVGHGLTSCTAEVLPIRLNFPDDDLLKHYTIILLDTPGFDDTYRQDAAILKLVADWLEKAYRHKKKLAGVIYLHDISEDRFSQTARRNLNVFNDMCGDALLSKVIFGTTKWNRTPEEVGKKHEDDLKEVHWDAMLKKGAKSKRFEDSRDSALSFIKHIVTDTLLKVCFRIQEEMVDDWKIIAETQAGRNLLWPLQDVLALHKEMLELEKVMAQGGDAEAAQRYKETKWKMDALKLKIQWSKVQQLLRKVKKFFGIF
ncbi:hypothetical protein D9613_003497 [Agrocybe pediades]|uniref:G domain-containing protein n=1 Tax=Agrocybe pediades TaxID=84607 RepID=A0A8H4VMH0_9AGAR|nr:hypothetical protein D9613_003497 [Agrocybe pediades]